MKSKRRKGKDRQHRNYAFAYGVQGGGQHVEVNINGPDDLEVRIEDTELYRLLLPFMTWMQLFGSLFSKNDGSIGRQRFVKPVSCLETIWSLFLKYGRQWSLLLCLFLVVIILVFVVLTTMLIAEFTLEMIFFCLFLILFLLLNAVGCIVYHRFNTTGKMLLLLRKYSELDISPSHKKILSGEIRKACMLITIIYTTAAGITIIGFSYLLNTAYKEKSETLVIYLLLDIFPFPLNKIAFYSLFVAGFLLINALFIHPSFIILISVIMFIILKQFNSTIESGPVTDEDDPDEGRKCVVECLHVKFQKIVEMVDVLDDAIGLYMLPFTGILISNLSLITYFMLFFCSDEFTKGVFISWVLLCVGVGMTVLLSAAMMNAMAMKSYESLHAMDISNLTSSSVMKFLMLIESVQREIGITSIGFFTITKEFIISLTATFFSYFFMLIEFSPSFSMCEPTNFTKELH